MFIGLAKYLFEKPKCISNLIMAGAGTIMHVRSYYSWCREITKPASCITLLTVAWQSNLHLTHLLLDAVFKTLKKKTNYNYCLQLTCCTTNTWPLDQLTNCKCTVCSSPAVISNHINGSTIFIFLVSITPGHWALQHHLSYHFAMKSIWLHYLKWPCLLGQVKGLLA